MMQFLLLCIVLMGGRAVHAISYASVTDALHNGILQVRQLRSRAGHESIASRDGRNQNGKQEDSSQSKGPSQGPWATKERFGQEHRDFKPENWPTAPKSSCPPIWNSIAQDLSSQMLDDAGQCNDLARAAIRSAFHDCFNNGCDGSLFLGGEHTRDENGGLAEGVPVLGELANKWNVGVADMLQFAGASAIALCPLGPRITTYVGRKDSSTAANEGDLPKVHDSGDSLFALFESKGFTAEDLAALLGAHSASKQFHLDQSQSGKSQDSTPGIWDVKYYQETLDGTSPLRLPSDFALMNHADVGPRFKAFNGNQFGWNTAFASAMTKMSLLGVEGGAASLTDCTSALPKSGLKREVRGSPL